MEAESLPYAKEPGMQPQTLVTNLLGRRARLQKPSGEQAERTGEIVAVYQDGGRLHFVVLVEGELVPVEGGARLRVLDEEDADW